MSFEEIRFIFIVYASSILPIILFMKYRSQLPNWVPIIYVGSFIVCALGWEIWFTYGLINGESVIERRADVSSTNGFHFILIGFSIHWQMLGQCA